MSCPFSRENGIFHLTNAFSYQEKERCENMIRHMKHMKKKLLTLLMLLTLTCTAMLGSSQSLIVTAAESQTISAGDFDYRLTAEDITIRDPYIVVYEGKYYMYGTDGATAFSGKMDHFPVYVSEDLEKWAGPYTIFENDGTFWADAQYWAPEVYYIDGEFYFYGSMGGSSRPNKGIQLFKSSDPLGPFTPVSEYPFTPEEDDDIDATLYEEDGIMYMVYSQGKDGFYAVKLNDTLDGFAEPQFKLFNVSDCSWTIPAFGDMILNDGACFYQTSSGRLICLFSSMSEEGYNMGIAYSDNGKLDGNWTVTDDRLDVGSDGGHCMLFENLDGDTMICYHAPNSASHPRFGYLVEDKEKDTVYVSSTPLVTQKVEDVFTDVNANDWFTSYVQSVYDNEIMTGLTPTTFAPSADLSRAQFATILYRMAGRPDVTGKSSFKDVDASAFYANAVNWASQDDVGIIAGYNKDFFGPSDNLTREQMVVMMYRYLDYMKVKDLESKSYDNFSDAGRVSPFAEKAMSWAVGSGIIQGDQGKLNPQGTSSRAQCAAALTRLIKRYDIVY